MIGLALGGCRAGPDYAPPAAPVAAEWTVQRAAALDPQREPDAQWWQAFQDPVLTGLVERVQAQNVSLQEADARVVESRARLGFARGALGPTVMQTDVLTATRFSDNGTPFGFSGVGLDPFSLWTLGFDAAWELDIAGKLRRGVEAADADLEASVEARHDLLLRLVGDVARTYVELRTAEERLEVARRNAYLQRETLQLTIDRCRMGAVSPLDVHQAKTQLEQTEAAIPELVNQVKLAENRLCILQGEPPRGLAEELQGRRPIPEPPAAIGVGLPADLLRRRPDVRQAEREVAAQAARIGVAAADLYPQLVLPGTLALSANDLSDVFRWDSLYYAAGPSLRWNVLNFGRVRSHIAAQEARAEQAIAQYRQTVLRAAEEAENGLSTLLRERERVAHLAVAARSAREAVAIAQQRYREGAVGFQSLLDVQRVLVQVEDQHAAARGRVAVAAIALYKALGGGWENPPALLFENPGALPDLEELPPAAPAAVLSRELTAGQPRASPP